MTTIEELVKNSLGYDITPERMEYWFDILNEGVFDEKLTKPEFIARRLRGVWGRCIVYKDVGSVEWGDLVFGVDSIRYVIEVHHRLGFSDFLDVLGHEMVHQYQSQVLNDHDCPEPDEDYTGSFEKFQERFNDFGINVFF